jgi:DNA-binding NtrC family response regulator
MTGPGGTIPAPLRPPIATPARSPGAGAGATAPANAPEARVAPESFDVTFKEAKERWVSSFERDYIVALLKKNNGNISHAAREADIDRKYFRKLMKKYAIEAAGAADEEDEELEG